MVRQIAASWEESFRNPWMGRQVSNGLCDPGFRDIQVQGELLLAPSFETSDQVFDLVQTAVRLAETTRKEEPLQWLSQARERDGVRPGLVVGHAVPERGATTLRPNSTALDRDINFLDNSWDYHDGDNEVRMGKALRDGYRQKLF